MMLPTSWIWSLAALLTILSPVNGRQNWKQRLASVDVDAVTIDAANYTPSDPIQYWPNTSNVTTQTPQFFPEHDSKKVKITYGPFDIRSMDDQNGMSDYIQIGARMPCNNCTVTFLQAGLEYPDGSYANANTSAWLHHVVLVDLSYNDTVCGRNFYGKGQRWFASGNERTPGDITRGGTVPQGYYLGNNDTNLMILELMNQAMDVQTVVLTIEYEYIEGFPQGFYETVPIWMDITGCGTSDAPAKTNTTFSYTSPPYTVAFAGAVIAEGAHLHDGGTTLDIVTNGNTSCVSTAYYGQTAGYYDAPNTMYVMGSNADPFGESQMQQMDHISGISGCYAPAQMLQPGDEIVITANYDFTAHMPMLNSDGSVADIMGISLIYAAPTMSEEAMMKFASVPAPVQVRPTLIDPAMEMGGNNAATSMSTMGTCTTADSPGNLSTAGLDMTVPDIQTDFLAAVLDDTCLQARSKPYARYFWYGIAVVIGLFTIKRGLRETKLRMHKRTRASGRVSKLQKPSKAVDVIRSITYGQFSPVNAPRVFKLPPTGTILMLMSYLVFILCLVFIKSSTGDDQSYQSIGVRAGWMTVAQLPLVILLANKRNFIDLFTAVGYERLNVLHRWVARGLFLTATFHFGFQNEGWRRLGLMHLEWTTDSCPPTGVAAYAILLWMNISTLAPFRNMAYEIFVLQHIVTFFGLIIAIMMHIPTTALYARTYVYIAVGLYLFSRLVQTSLYAYRNIRPGGAIITRLSDKCVQVRVKGCRVRSWTPGSFVLLGVPRFGLFQSHPATIVSTPTSHDGDLVFVLRTYSGFTRALNGAVGTKRRTALVDGPYGGKQDDLAAYSTVVLIAGSTGISFVLPILADMAERSGTGSKLPVQNVHLVWSAKDGNLLKSLMPSVQGYLSQLHKHGIRTVSHIHLTGEYESSDVDSADEKAPSESSMSMTEKEKEMGNKTRILGVRTYSAGSSSSDDGRPSQRIANGRATLGNVISAAAAGGTEANSSSGDTAVAVCGPLSMTKDVRNSVSGMKGIYLHVEGFSW